MEKGSPQYKLSVVKTLIEAGRIRVTASAVAGAELLGFNRIEMINVVTGLLTSTRA